MLARPNALLRTLELLYGRNPSLRDNPNSLPYGVLHALLRLPESPPKMTQPLSFRESSAERMVTQSTP